MIGLVAMLDGKPAVLIAELPNEENEQFQIVRYGLYALKHAYNVGMKFNRFRVPKENLLVPPSGDGLTIAYHGLNLGRLALCAGAAASHARLPGEHSAVGGLPQDLRPTDRGRANWSNAASPGSPP